MFNSKKEKSLLAPNTIHYKISDRDKEREITLLNEILAFFQNHAGTPLEAYDDFIGQASIEKEIELKEVNVEDVKGWWCIPSGASSEKAILYIHGGAYAMGSAKAFRGMGSRVSKLTDVSLFLVDYPLSGETGFPAAPNTIIKAYKWLLAQGYKSIVVMGDSAGGGLCLAILQQLAAASGIVQPKGAVVFSPWTDLTLGGASWTDPNISDKLINYDVIQSSAKAYAGNTDLKTPLVSPIYGDMKNLPPLLFQVSANEHLLDDSVNFAVAAAKAGVYVRLEIWEDMHHVFHNDFDHLECSKKALDKAAEFVINVLE